MTNTEIGRSLASSFVEMASALDKLPQVEADLASANAELDKLSARIAFLTSHNSELGDRVITLEAALANATKSSESHKGNVTLMLDEVRKAIGQLAVLTDIVDPQPIAVTPEPEAIDLPNPLSSGQSDPMTGGVTSPDVSVGDPNRVHGTVMDVVAQSPFVPPTSPSGSEPTSTVPNGGQSESPPTASASTTTPNVSTNGASPNTDAETPNNTDGDKLASDPRPYWLKPSNMTWNEWKSHNGDVPSWVPSDRLNDLY